MCEFFDKIGKVVSDIAHTTLDPYVLPDEPTDSDVQFAVIICGVMGLSTVTFLVVMIRLLP